MKLPERLKTLFPGIKSSETKSQIEYQLSSQFIRNCNVILYKRRGSIIELHEGQPILVSTVFHRKKAAILRLYSPDVDPNSIASCSLLLQHDGDCLLESWNLNVNNIAIADLMLHLIEGAARSRRFNAFTGVIPLQGMDSQQLKDIFIKYQYEILPDSHPETEIICKRIIDIG